jgi:hypothetical protein
MDRGRSREAAPDAGPLEAHGTSCRRRRCVFPTGHAAPGRCAYRRGHIRLAGGTGRGLGGVARRGLAGAIAAPDTSAGKCGRRRTASRFARRASAVSRNRRQMVVAVNATGLGRLPGGRHGTGQDHPGAHEEISSRQEKALVFSQFREMADPLATFLATIFGCGGLVLHGGTPVGRRKQLVDRFQSEPGPPEATKP